MKQVYQHIHHQGPLTKPQLMELTKMKQTTITRYLEELAELQLIKFSKYDASTGGRPPAMFEIQPSGGFIIGVDLSRIHTEIVLFDLLFTPIEQCSFPMTKQHTPQVTIGQIVDQIQIIIKKHNISNQQLLGIGLGTVGPIDRENGTIINPRYFHAPGWEEVAIVKALQEHFALRIRIDNGANTAVLGEYKRMKAAKEQTILYCISGRGLRCGVLHQGQIIQNKIGDASAFGEMILHAASPVNMEHNQTLSQFISLETLKEKVNQQLDRGEIDSSEELLQRLNEGDPFVKEVVLESAYYYGIGIANMINIISPDRIILNSPILKVFPAYYEKVVETAKAYIYRLDRHPGNFEMGSEDENAVSLGAAVMVFNSFFE